MKKLNLQVNGALPTYLTRPGLQKKFGNVMKRLLYEVCT